MEVVVWLIIILIGIAALLSFVFAYMISYNEEMVEYCKTHLDGMIYVETNVHLLEAM